MAERGRRKPTEAVGEEMLRLMNVDPAAFGFPAEAVIVAVPNEGRWAVHRVGRDILVIELDPERDGRWGTEAWLYDEMAQHDPERDDG